VHGSRRRLHRQWVPIVRVSADAGFPIRLPLLRRVVWVVACVSAMQSCHCPVVACAMPRAAPVDDPQPPCCALPLVDAHTPGGHGGNSPFAQRRTGWSIHLVIGPPECGRRNLGGWLRLCPGVLHLRVASMPRLVRFAVGTLVPARVAP
jgi:hypothetical protein